MSLLVKVDEDLPVQVADCFSRAGYSATTVRIQGWSGISDQKLWRRVQVEDRILVTADKGFGNIRLFQPSPMTAIVLLRTPQQSRRSYVEGGAVGNFGGTVSVENAVFTGNQAGFGAALYNDGTLTISNTTFNANSATGTGGAIHSDATASTGVVYSILWGDAPDEIFDLHLGDGSQCIDSANGDEATSSDIEGIPRVDDPDASNGVGDPPYVDMGAFEHL